MEKIPVFAPYVTDDITKLSVENALTEGFLGMGKVVNQFEKNIENYLELKDRHVVAVNTGTSALHLAVELCDIQKDDEVIVPSFNFVAAYGLCGFSSSSEQFSSPWSCCVP